MERLRLTAVKRGRDFLLERIFELRQPSSNIQMQQNVLIRHRHVIKFLREHGSNAYAELRGEYCSNVSTKFMDVFKGYWACLEGMESGDRGVLLGGMVQPSSYYEYFESLFEAKGGSEDARVAFFQLKDRLANSSRRVLEAPIMPSVTKGDQVPFESIFASISRLLVDSAAHEYMFCKNFWQGEGHSVFRDTFRPILDFIHGSLNASIQDQEDVIALMLCININRENFLLMTKRRNPALDEHFDAINLLLWPRVKMVLDRHLQSVLDLKLEESTKFGKAGVLPVTRRYAAMMASVLVIEETITDGSVSLNIEQLKYAVLNYLLMASRKFPRRGEGTVFLLHNLHHVVSVLRESGKAQHSFDEAFSTALDLYIDSKLKPRLEIPKELGARTVDELRQEIRAEFNPSVGLTEIVEKTCTTRLCAIWGEYLAKLASEGDRTGLMSMADLFKLCTD